MKKRILTLLAVLTLLIVSAAFAVNADPLDPAAITCPCGGTSHEWTTVTSADGLSTLAAGGHYHVTANVDLTSVLTVPAGKVVILVDNCTLNLNGGSDTARPIDMSASGAKLYMIGNKADVNFVPYNNATGSGGLAEVGTANTTAELHLYGGLNIQRSSTSTNKPKSGGFFVIGNGRVQLHAKTNMGLPTDAGDPALTGYDITAGTTETDNHGGIFLLGTHNNARVFIDAGTVTGGTADRGAVAATNRNARFIVNGGTIIGGTALNQGAVFFGSHGYFVLLSGLVQMNTITNSGIRVQDSGRIYLKGGTVKTVVNAGAIDVTDSTADNATTNYSPYLAIGADVKFLNLQGKESSENYIIRLQHSASATSTGLYYSYLQIDNNFKGKVGIDKWLQRSGSKNQTYTWGSYIGKLGSTYFGICGALTIDVDANTYSFSKKGTLHADAEISFKSTITKPICGESGNLLFPRAIVLEGNDTNRYVASANAGFAYINTNRASLDMDTTFVRMCTAHGVTVPENMTDAVLCLNGKTPTSVSIPETSHLTVFNKNSTTTEADAASVPAALWEKIPHAIDAPDGYKYVALKDAANEKITFHRASLEISSVNLRPEAEKASLYYTAEITGDATLMAAVDAGTVKVGVAVTLDETAGSDSLSKYLYTEYNSTSEKYNGVLVNGIINKNGTDNGTRAVKDIHARAYMMQDDDVIMSADAPWNLLEVVNKVATDRYGDLDETQKGLFDELYSWCSLIVLPEGTWESKVDTNA